MPHVTVKLWLGKSELQKNRLAEATPKTLWAFCITEKSRFR
jgi:phenylpyruvate tautomerase PptA (4-oxalocrotonate tautomerase family)